MNFKQTVPELKKTWADVVRRLEPCYPLILPIVLLLCASGRYLEARTGTSNLEPPKGLKAEVWEQYGVLEFPKECVHLLDETTVTIELKDNGDPDYSKVHVSGLKVDPSCGVYKVRKRRVK